MFRKLLFIVLLLSSFSFVNAQSHTIPTLDGNNTWTGENIFTPGKLGLSSTIAPCPSGQYVTGFDEYFNLTCSTITVPTNSCSGGISCPLTGSVYNFTYSGEAGSGNVNSAGAYARGVYPSAGTTIGGSANSIEIPTGVSTSQINSAISGSGLSVTLDPGGPPVPFTNSNYNTVHDDNTVVAADAWNMRASGAVCDAQIIVASITADSNTITTGYDLFTTAINDGATWIETVGTVDGVPTRFDATLTYVSPTEATLSTSAPFTNTAGAFIFGHKDDNAIAAAISLGISTGRQITAPNGICWTSVPQRLGANIVGHGSIIGGFSEANQGTVFLGSAGEDVFQSSLATGTAPANLNTGGYTIELSAGIDATKPWQICGPTSSCTSQTPLYRPIGILGPDAQDPLAPQWIEGGGTYDAGAINGLAFVTNGDSTITVLSGNTPPVVGEQIVFPYLSTVFSTTVSSVSGQSVVLSDEYPGSTIQPVGTASACSIEEVSGNWTATITVSNSLSSGNVVGISGFSTTACKQLNGYAWTVISSGLSSSQFEATAPAGVPYAEESTTDDTGTIFLAPVAAQEWFAGTSFQNIQTAIPSSTARTASITAWSISSNIATFTASNGYSAGQVLTLSGFDTSTFFNGQQVTVLSSGLSSSQFEADFTHGNASNTEDGSSSVFPLVVALANPIIPIPAPQGSSPAGVAPFGYVQIGAEQCAYYGNSNYPASPSSVSSPTITLQACAQNSTSAAGHDVGSIIVPLNPFEPTWPWPVTPTIMSGVQTPTNAEFFPAQGVGNAAISFPVPNGSDYSSAIGMAGGRIHDVLIAIGGGAASTAVAGNQIQNDTAAMYIAVQPFDSTISNIYITNTFYGIVEGAPSTNTNSYFTNGFPTADGNHWINIFDQSSALPMDIISEGSGMFTGLTFFSQSYAPPNNYIPGFVPVIATGSQGNLMLDSPYDDQLNTYPYASTGVQFTTFQFKYLEPETGMFNQTQPLDYWNCLYCTWINTTPKGSAVRFINGEFQQFYGGTLNINATTPIVLLGSNINFEHVAGMGSSSIGTTYGSNAVLNWGESNTAYGPGDNIGGTVAGPNIPQLGGDSFAPIIGQTDDTLATGNTAIPYVAKGMGYFSPEQIPPTTLDPAPMTGGWTFDATSPISNSYVTCAGEAGFSCTPTHMTGDYVPIGAGQRIIPGPYYGHVSFKTPSGASSFTFRLFAVGNGSCTGGTVYSTTITSSDSGWHDYPITLADFTGDSGCLFTINITNGSESFDAELGYLDMIPMPSSAVLPVTTPTEGGSCSQPGSFLGSDSSYIYICASGGTVKRVGIS